MSKWRTTKLMVAGAVCSFPLTVLLVHHAAIPPSWHFAFKVAGIAVLAALPAYILLGIVFDRQNHRRKWKGLTKKEIAYLEFIEKEIEDTARTLRKS
jgi:UDP-N-acetylmuramyl pentapeptide phosphotransferase/UDP-N-acetylglucosamine-1-phosphate transferase